MEWHAPCGAPSFITMLRSGAPRCHTGGRSSLESNLPSVAKSAQRPLAHAGSQLCRTRITLPPFDKPRQRGKAESCAIVVRTGGSSRPRRSSAAPFAAATAAILCCNSWQGQNGAFPLAIPPPTVSHSEIACDEPPKRRGARFGQNARNAKAVHASMLTPRAREPPRRARGIHGILHGGCNYDRRRRPGGYCL